MRRNVDNLSNSPLNSNLSPFRYWSTWASLSSASSGENSEISESLPVPSALKEVHSLRPPEFVRIQRSWIGHLPVCSPPIIAIIVFGGF